MMSSSLSQNTFVVRRPGLAIFADIMKTVTVFIKKYLMTQRKIKRNRQIIKMQSISLFFGIAKFVDFQLKNADVSRTQGVCHVIHIFFGSSIGKV